MKIKTDILIHATPDRVWQVFSDFSQYPQWNPFIKSLTGTVGVGKTIKIVLPGMTFTPVVLAFEPNRELRWRGQLLFKGLFDGEHYFTLVDNGNGTTTFVHGENFSGILVPLFRKKLETETAAGFAEMNARLKDRVENRM